MRKLILAMLAVAAVVIVAAGIFLTSRIRAVSADLAAAHRKPDRRCSCVLGPARDFLLAALFGVPWQCRHPGRPRAPPRPRSPPSRRCGSCRPTGYWACGDEGIAEIVLERPSINLIVSADGRANWNYGAKHRNGEPQGLPLRIADGRIAFLDERSGAAAEVHQCRTRKYALAGPADELTAKGVFVWNERRAAFTLFLKSPQRVAEDGSPADRDASGAGTCLSVFRPRRDSPRLRTRRPGRDQGTDLGLAASWFGAALPAGMNGARFELAGAVETSSKGLGLHQCAIRARRHARRRRYRHGARQGAADGRSQGQRPRRST